MQLRCACERVFDIEHETVISLDEHPEFEIGRAHV